MDFLTSHSHFASLHCMPQLYKASLGQLFFIWPPSKFLFAACTFAASLLVSPRSSQISPRRARHGKWLYTKRFILFRFLGSLSLLSPWFIIFWFHYIFILLLASQDEEIVCRRAFIGLLPQGGEPYTPRICYHHIFMIEARMIIVVSPFKVLHTRVRAFTRQARKR